MKKLLRLSLLTGALIIPKVNELTMYNDRHLDELITIDNAFSLSEKFYVNNTIGTGCKHYLVEVNREKGEREIKNLLSSDIEESWLFIKGATFDGRQTERWYENGEDATNLRIKNMHNPDRIFSDFLFINEISFYHTHPEDKEINKNIKRSESDTPSAIDIVSFFKIQGITDFYAKIRKINNYDLDFRIITPIGIYIIKIPDINSEKDIDKINKAIGDYSKERLRYVFIHDALPLEELLDILRDADFKVDLKGF